MTSSRMTSKRPAEARARPAGPSVADWTSYPAAASRSERVRTRPGSSSTSSIREGIHLFRGGGWHTQEELGATAGLARDRDGSLVRFHNPPDEVQAQAGAMDLVLDS